MVSGTCYAIPACFGSELSRSDETLHHAMRRNYFTEGMRRAQSFQCETKKRWLVVSPGLLDSTALDVGTLDHQGRSAQQIQ